MKNRFQQHSTGQKMLVKDIYFSERTSLLAVNTMLHNHLPFHQISWGGGGAAKCRTHSNPLILPSRFVTTD